MLFFPTEHNFSFFLWGKPQRHESHCSRSAWLVHKVILFLCVSSQHSAMSSGEFFSPFLSQLPYVGSLLLTAAESGSEFLLCGLRATLPCTFVKVLLLRSRCVTYFVLGSSYTSSTIDSCYCASLFTILFNPFSGRGDSNCKQERDF